MASHIKKLVCNKEVYYKGNDQWTEMFTERKQFNNEGDANEEHHRYSGVVINE
jgi:hypothetical protein